MSDSTFAIPIDRACVACGKEFIVTPAEMVFRNEHRLSLPDLCPTCRARQRSDRNADIVAAYAKAGSSVYTDIVSAAPNPPSRKGTVRGQMYATVCDSCGAETKVPFIPRGDRPVYCRDCYNARRGR